jgi:hypothetical protein
MINFKVMKDHVVLSRIYTDSPVNRTTCSSMCAFDFIRNNNENCHFFALDGDKCYLGMLNYETSLLETAPATEVNLKTSEFMGCKYCNV